MSLHASLSINATSIGSLYAMRQECRDFSAPGIDDAVNTYDVMVVYTDDRRLPWTGVVRQFDTGTATTGGSWCAPYWTRRQRRVVTGRSPTRLPMSGLPRRRQSGSCSRRYERSLR